MTQCAIHILIVEDSATQALQLQHVLQQRGWRVSSAQNGREALTALDTETPTLVITDINMPEMNGYELCQRIKDDAKLKELPVILLTSLSDPKDILRGIECGADNFVVKPYDEGFLLSRIENVLANLELRGQPKEGDRTDIFFAGQKYHITSNRTRNLDLLLSTYETAVQKNMELTRAKQTLEKQAGELREKNAQMEADLEMARELQTSFLPHKYPVFAGTALRFCHRYHAATKLGGDYFNVFALSDTDAGVFICDVMGHGVRAALMTAIIRGLVEEFRPVAADPGRFLMDMNHRLCEILKQSPTPLFATAFYGVVDLAHGELRYAIAGHPSPLLSRKYAEVEPLEVPVGKLSGALGIYEHFRFSTLKQSVGAGDRLLLFTDGLCEAEGPDQTAYGMQRLIETVRKGTALATEKLCDQLMAEARSFTINQAFEDDVCLVGMDVVRLAEV